VNQLRESIKAELDRLKLTQDIKIRSIDGDVPYTGDYLDCIMDITPNGDYTIWNDDSKMTLAYDVTLNYKEDTNIRTLFHILFTLNNL
jgi:hypothetical protein